MKKGFEKPQFKARQIDQLHDLFEEVMSGKLKKQDAQKIRRWKKMAEIMEKAQLTPNNLDESETLDQKRIDWWKEMAVKLGKKEV